ncbi:bile acid:sodium symporter family protein [Candidatus Formimonas warabiya]|uniref:Bile acid:sodium symporter n=1 Tax=Formimonas warabiya TaxID=1761012 RepID=A0A3G1KU99_FORW1|nr:bile acid:sodium symporter family protein [Candidatus Formimonas warabiya]ATW25755.1 bile acid:sodium symporter [Candidatus Formimonas warabiya]
MMKMITAWDHWLGKRMFFVVLSALLIGFNLSLPQSPLYTSIAIGLFAYMTFISALGTSFKEFVQVVRKPWIPIWMLFLIHAGAPVIAWMVGSIFYPHDQLIRLGFLISASIPVGVTSIIWTSLTEGSVSLALVIVTLDTLLVPMILPAFFLITVGQALTINYPDLIIQLLFMVTIPSLAGMFLNDMTGGRLRGFSKSIGAFTSKGAFFLVILINAAMVASEIPWNVSLIKLLLVVLLLVACGYMTGFIGSLVVKDRRSDVISPIIYNVGMRNIGFGALLAISYFPPAVAVPVTLAMLYQQPVAAVVASLFRRYQAKEAASTLK